MIDFINSFFSSEVTDSIVANYIDTGKIHPRYLQSIAKKMKAGKALTQNESVIFYSSTAEINDLLRKL